MMSEHGRKHKLSIKSKFFAKITKKGKYHLVIGGDEGKMYVQCSIIPYSLYYGDLKDEIDYDDFCSKCGRYEI